MTPVPLSLRSACQADCELLFTWANDPVTRANSFTPAAIPWMTHTAWLADVLGDPRRLLYVVLANGDQPIGQSRFDPFGEQEAEISMSLAAEWRGRGLAAPAIRLATEYVLGAGRFGTVHAFVRPANDRSRRAFVRAGYTERELTSHRGHPAVHLGVDSLRGESYSRQTL